MARGQGRPAGGVAPHPRGDAYAQAGGADARRAAGEGGVGGGESQGDGEHVPVPRLAPLLRFRQGIRGRQQTGGARRGEPRRRRPLGEVVVGEPHVRARDDAFSAGDGSKVGGGSEVRQQGQASLPRVQRPKQRRDEHRPRVPPARTDDDASSGLVAHGCAIAVGVARADGKRSVQRRRIDRVRGVPKSIAKSVVVRGRRCDAKEPVGASRRRDGLQHRSIQSGQGTIARGEEAGVCGIARPVGRSREERQRRTNRADRVPRRRVHSRRGARGRSPRTQATGTHRQGLLGRFEVEIPGVEQGAAQERDTPAGTGGRTQAEGR